MKRQHNTSWEEAFTWAFVWLVMNLWDVTVDYCHSTCLLFPKQLSLLTNANAMSSRNAAGTASLFRDCFLSFFSFNMCILFTWITMEAFIQHAFASSSWWLRTRSSLTLHSSTANSAGTPWPISSLRYWSMTAGFIIIAITPDFITLNKISIITIISNIIITIGLHTMSHFLFNFLSFLR